MKIYDRILIVSFLWAPGSQFLARVFDGLLNSSKYSPLNGLDSMFNYSLIYQIVLMFCIFVMVLVKFMISNPRTSLNKKMSENGRRNKFWLAILCIGVFTLYISREAGLKETIGVICFLLLVSSKVLFTEKGMHFLAKLSFFITLTIAFYAILVPSLSWVPCRINKCTYASGGLLTSYFAHENYLGIYVSLSLYFCIYLKSKLGKFLFGAIASAIVYLTGSLVSYLMTFLILMIILKRKSVLTRILPVFPLSGLIMSFIVFITVSGSELSGRGSIYDAIKANFWTAPWIGRDESQLSELYLSGKFSTKFFAFHEHGLFPYLAFQFGLLGILCGFFLAIMALRLRRMAEFPMHAVPILVVSVSFLTEEILSPSLFSPFSWVIVLALGSQVADKAQIHEAEKNLKLS